MQQKITAEPLPYSGHGIWLAPRTESGRKLEGSEMPAPSLTRVASVLRGVIVAGVTNAERWYNHIYPISGPEKNGMHRFVFP